MKYFVFRPFTGKQNYLDLCDLCFLCGENVFVGPGFVGVGLIVQYKEES